MGCNAIIFVVDSVDVPRIGQSKFELHKMLDNQSLTNVPILIVGNKVDIVSHMREAEIIERCLIRVEFGLFAE